MIIIHPIETFAELFWEDFKENKREWLVLLLWTIPVDSAFMFLGWVSDKVRERNKRRADNTL